VSDEQIAPTEPPAEVVSEHRRARRRSWGPIARLGGAFTLVAATLAAAFSINVLSAAPAQPTLKGSPHAGRPLRVLLVGDSLAGTLGVGLASAARASNVELVNAAMVGCSVAIAWNQGWASTVGVPGPPAYPCQSRDQLTTYWVGLLRSDRPDVVIYASHMDTVEQESSPGSSTMISVADPSFAGRLTQSLSEAVSVLHSTGASVIVTNSAPTKTNLVGNANDAPASLAAYGVVVNEVAASSRGAATAFDLAGILGGPGSPPSFSLASPAGVEWRCLDGIHVSQAGGELVAPALFLLAWQVSLVAHGPPLERPAPPLREVNQPWAPYLAQRHAMGCPQ